MDVDDLSRGPRVIVFFDMIWWGIGYSAARLILPVVSFGKVRVEPLECRDNRFGWLCYRRDGSGHLEVVAELGAGIGLVACCIGLAIVLHFLR